MGYEFPAGELPPLPGLPAGSALSITKTAPAQAGIDTEVTYTVAVGNPTAVAATAVVVTDTLPPGGAFLRASEAASVNGKVITFTPGDLGGGVTHTITMVVTYSSPGTKTN